MIFRWVILGVMGYQGQSKMMAIIPIKKKIALYKIMNSFH